MRKKIILLTTLFLIFTATAAAQTVTEVPMAETTNYQSTDFSFQVDFNNSGYITQMQFSSTDMGNEATVSVKETGDSNDTLVSNSQLMDGGCCWSVDLSKSDYTREINEGETVEVVISADYSLDITNDYDGFSNSELSISSGQDFTAGDNSTAGLTAETTEPNTVPTVSNVTPADGATDVSTDVNLSATYGDADGDTGTLSFYWGNDTLIESHAVSDGDTVETSLTLDYNTSYGFYAESDDGTDTTTSSTHTFTTEEQTTDSGDSDTGTTTPTGSDTTDTSDVIGVVFAVLIIVSLFGVALN